MFINNRSQPALLTFVKLKGFSMFQQYCLWRNSFEQIHKILYEKCSWKKIKFCLFNKKLDILKAIAQEEAEDEPSLFLQVISIDRNRLGIHQVHYMPYGYRLLFLIEQQYS